jgi:hypothetical protein
MSKHTQLDLLVYGHNIANLIRKHGGWLDDNDSDVVRFPSPYAKARFEEELDARQQRRKHG